jgi:hypothetical protein
MKGAKIRCNNCQLDVMSISLVDLRVWGRTVNTSTCQSPIASFDGKSEGPPQAQTIATSSCPRPNSVAR